MKHILLKNAFAYKKRKLVKEPKGYIFDYKLGAWVDSVKNTLLVNSLQFCALSTKKHDIETGEDQKGE